MHRTYAAMSKIPKPAMSTAPDVQATQAFLDLFERTVCETLEEPDTPAEPEPGGASTSQSAPSPTSVASAPVSVQQAAPKPRRARRMRPVQLHSVPATTSAQTPDKQQRQSAFRSAQETDGRHDPFQRAIRKPERFPSGREGSDANANHVVGPRLKDRVTPRRSRTQLSPVDGGGDSARLEARFQDVSQSANLTSTEGAPVTADDIETFTRDSAFEEHVNQHAIHIANAFTSAPAFSLRAIHTLYVASTNPPQKHSANYKSRSRVVAHAKDTLRKLTPLLETFPACISNNLRITQLNSTSTLFPTPAARWTYPLPPNLSLLSLQSESKSQTTHKLHGNLEAAWDALLSLLRAYRGDIASHAPGTIDTNSAHKVMACLHPANMDLFACRLVSLLSRTTISETPAEDEKNAKLRALNTRLKQSKSKQGKSGRGSGVVLHRVPACVRDLFGAHVDALFMLDFLTCVDSAKLYVALTPRLKAQMASCVNKAVCCSSNQSFTDAVSDARTYARFLGVVKHSVNWAHSPFSLEGGGMQSGSGGNGLGSEALRWRVEMHSCMRENVVDVVGLLKSAIESREIVVILAVLCVCDVVIRLAAVDPVAKASEWFRLSMCALKSLRVVGDTEMGEVCMPLVSTMVEDLLRFTACNESYGDVVEAGFEMHCDSSVWFALGDVRFLKACCPVLHTLRMQLACPPEIQQNKGKSASRRITPKQTVKSNGSTFVSATGANAVPNRESAPKVVKRPRKNGLKKTGDMQDILRSECCSRMDGRLRELIGVVVSSQPKGEREASEAYTKIAGILYPDTSETVVAVAANICAYQLAEIQIELEAAEEEEVEVDGGGAYTAGKDEVSTLTSGVTGVRLQTS